MACGLYLGDRRRLLRDPGAVGHERLRQLDAGHSGAAATTSIDASTGPVVYSVGTTLLLGGDVHLPPVLRAAGRRLDACSTCRCSLMGLSMTDRNFYAIVSKPDNVPIVALVFLLGFFTWLATSKAVENDERIAQGCRRWRSSTTRRCWSGPTWSTPS